MAEAAGHSGICGQGALAQLLDRGYRTHRLERQRHLPNKQVTSEWGTQEWVHFLSGMGATLKPEQLKQLDEAYHFTGTPNGEIAMRWYPLAIRSGYTDARAAAGEFIERVGRRKLVLPIYAELLKTPDGIAFAEQAFERPSPAITRSPPHRWPR